MGEHDKAEQLANAVVEYRTAEAAVQLSEGAIACTDCGSHTATLAALVEVQQMEQEGADAGLERNPSAACPS